MKNEQTYKIRTDLALEMQELLEESSELEGIRIITKMDKKTKIKETVIDILNQKGEKQLGKPVGTYITMEGEDLSKNDGGYHEEMAFLFGERMYQMIKGANRILVAGLGNKEVTPDALGPYVVEHLFVTRHLKREKLVTGEKEISAIVPGVMAQTGMETREILRGIIKSTKPEILICIDALAARNSARLNKTIQISDTGIAPGSGVGNHRAAITKETMGIPVIAVGVPTVIGIPSIINDALDAVMKIMGDKNMKKILREYSESERLELVCELLDPNLAGMFVTPKNIDESVKRISYTISEGLNRWLE